MVFFKTMNRGTFLLKVLKDSDDRLLIAIFKRKKDDKDGQSVQR